MGNLLTSKCCVDEDEVYARLRLPQLPPPVSILRNSSEHQIRMPFLIVTEDDATVRRNGAEPKRLVRVVSPSPSPISVMDEDYDSESSNDQVLKMELDITPSQEESPKEEFQVIWTESLPSSSAPISTSALKTKLVAPTPPPLPESSGLRVLLASASARSISAEYESDDENKREEESDMKSLPSMTRMRRVDRHDSLCTVIKSSDENAVKFAHICVADVPSEIELPDNLVFAFLDDSAIARKVFTQMIKGPLRASSKSIVRGETLDGALQFKDAVMEMKPDMVVLDQVLVYETHTLLGIDIARALRDDGFQGCVVIQTASEDLKDNVDYGVVDACFDRCVPASAFAMARVVAMRRHQDTNGLSSTATSMMNGHGKAWSFGIDQKLMDNGAVDSQKSSYASAMQRDDYDYEDDRN